MTPSIIVFIPYFGKWPVWMDLYVDSIKRNSSIDFYFFTDCDCSIFEGIPTIKYDQCSFEDYIARFKNVLGNDINIPNPYKICDLRPFFGLIHEQEIQGYDFFGWTDVDIFYGDLRSFYTAEILKKYEVLSTHKTRLSGHLAILKNSAKHKKIGFKIYRWKDALRNPAFVGIDEHGITNALQMTLLDKIAEKFRFSKNRSLLNWLRKLKTKRHYFVEQYTTPFMPIKWKDGSLNSAQPDEWFYEQGVISNSRDKNIKFMYLHLMNFKSSTWRADGTIAPWENGFECLLDDLENKIIIDLNGIRSLR